MRDHDVALVATDTITFEVYPCEDPNVFMPVHMIQLRDMGLAQGQNWHLDDLAAACAGDGRIDCLLVATPLPLTGAAGAPVAPTAIRWTLTRPVALSIREGPVPESRGDGCLVSTVCCGVSERS
jgi:hypothetical protein